VDLLSVNLYPTGIFLAEMQLLRCHLWSGDFEHDKVKWIYRNLCSSSKLQRGATYKFKGSYFWCLSIKGGLAIGFGEHCKDLETIIIHGQNK
jgi:hypothetical protein